MHNQVPWTRRQVSAAALAAAAVAATERESEPATGSGSAGSGSGSGSAGSVALEGGRVLLTCPELQLFVGGRFHLRVVRNLFTGKLMVKPGGGISASFQLDHIRSEIIVGRGCCNFYVTNCRRVGQCTLAPMHLSPCD